MSVQEITSQASPDTALPSVIRELLQKRGLKTDEQIHSFLNPDYARDVSDPYLMTDMDLLVERVVRAVKGGEKVAVYGDYDIDGVVSTALMCEVLRLHGLEPIHYIPDRYEEGYGLNQAALEKLKADGVTLVITVDCGITSVEELEWANQNGLDVLITDHHEVPSELPEAIAVVNPHREGDAYPCKDLAGVGVAFAVARALQQKTGVPSIGQEKWLLDLVALGTVCDVMPLTGENRALVHFGLIVLRKTRRVGLVALAQAAGIELSEVRPYHLGFVIGPRMNAAGRLEHATTSLELISTTDAVKAQQLAYELEELNHKRQVDQARIVAEADAMAEQYSDYPVLVLGDASWSHGIVGIVASKIAEKWQKPTVIFQILGENAKGSGRSANGYNLIEGMRHTEELFSKLGGHHFAAGCTIPVNLLDDFREGINDHYRAVEDELPPQKLNREPEVILENPSDLNWELYDTIQLLEPFGNGNPQPALGVRGLKIVDVGHVGKAKEHLKLRLAAGSGAIFEAIGFNLSEKYNTLRPGQAVDVTVFLEKNQFNNKTQLQLVILDL